MTEDLSSLARREFGTLSVAEAELLHAASTGDCGLCDRITPFDNFSDPAEADGWGTERKVRASLIRWLCVVPSAAQKVVPPGLQIRRAKIDDPLSLVFCAIPFSISFLQCRLGAVDLRHSTILALTLSGSLVQSLNGDGLEVKDSVSLDVGFRCNEVRFVSARIGGSLNCAAGTIRNTDGPALRADRIEVKGDVLLRNEAQTKAWFSAVGEIRLRDAQIGGNLDCTLGEFRDVNLERATIKGTFFWRGVRSCSSLDLADVSVGVLTDDQESWPPQNNLYLEGLVYGRIIAAPIDVSSRLQWISKQEDFSAQPYKQFAKLLTEMGDDDGATRVLYELEKRRRAQDRKRLATSIQRLLNSGEDELANATVGYGFYPRRAVKYSLLFAGLGWLLFWRARRAGTMVPKDREAYVEFKKGKLPPDYARFNPLIYSIENCIPLVKLGQDELWQPDPAPLKQNSARSAIKGMRLVQWMHRRTVSPGFLRAFRWFAIAVGWLLAIFLVAGITGMIKTH